MADQLLWWLSFVDPTKAPPLEEQVPGGVSFLGVAIVRGVDFLQAVSNAHFLGCNPGGEVQGYPIPSAAPVDPRWIGRLLSREEIDELESEMEAKWNALAQRAEDGDRG